MALFTGQGDDGKTKLFACDQKLSKSSRVADALGDLDELNSWLGVCKTKVKDQGVTLAAKETPWSLAEVLEEAQNNLFLIQAELAGADKHLPAESVAGMEKLIGEIEQELPLIKNFVVAGGTELSALLDYARAVARRAERKMVAVAEAGDTEVEKDTLAYLNRLSSLLFALARLANHQAGVVENRPVY